MTIAVTIHDRSDQSQEHRQLTTAMKHLSSLLGHDVEDFADSLVADGGRLAHHLHREAVGQLNVRLRL